MTISNKEKEIELRRFEDTKLWIAAELKDTVEKCKKYDEKVSNLKKGAGGAYSTDLILAENVRELGYKNLHKYRESSKNPYFARIDFREKLRGIEEFYIGKFGLIDEKNMKQVVIDWRAPLANLYYSGTFGEASYKAPQGKISGELLLKRKFQVKEGKVINIFDEGINELMVPTTEDGEGLVDEFLKVNLEENMSSKLKDVVTTIQKEQNDIIRAYKNKPIIIQGSAGSGKTTVALHRLAYLVYTYGDEMNNKNILVVAPNELFLDYISDILPNLGVSNVKQVTFDNLCNEVVDIKYKVISKDNKLSNIIEYRDSERTKYVTASSKIKGSISYKLIMDKLVRYMEKTNAQLEDIYLDDFILYSAKDIKRLYLRDLCKIPINKRRKEIERYFTGKLKNRLEKVKEDIEESYYFKIKDVKKSSISEEKKREKIIKIYDERDELIKKLNAKGKKSLKEYFNRWTEIDPIESYKNLFKDDQAFDIVIGNVIPRKLADFMRAEVINNIENNNIDSDDVTAITYLKLKLNGTEEGNYIHIVIDEAQDYSFLQFEVLRELTKNNSMTIVGDLGQGIYNYKGINSWNELISKVFNEEATYITLSQSYRSTVEIIEFANLVLDKQNLGIRPAKPILRHGDKPKLIDIDNKSQVNIIDDIVKGIYSREKKTIAIICKDFEECNGVYEDLKNKSIFSWALINDKEKNLERELLIIPSYMTKGLEFDATIVYNCDDNNYKDNILDKKLLYVVLTRALHLEYILFRKKISLLLKK